MSKSKTPKLKGWEEFLQFLSCDLKHPLANVIGFTSLLAQTADEQNLSPQVQTHLYDILAAAENLHRAINNLLDSSPPLPNSVGAEAEDEPAADIAHAQNIIHQLQQQLEIMQSQNLAYARDLAKLYQMQKADQSVIKSRSAQLSHTERLALMGQLAAGVAHDLSNLIGPILGYSQIILRRRDAIDPNLVDIIERIFSTSRRANTLLRQMVSLSRSETDQFEPFDLNKLAADMLRLLDVKIRYANVEVVEEYAENLPPVYGSSVQISQIILNLVINAIDAMPDGGILTLKTIPPSPEEPTFVRLQVTDTGCGIPPENLERIFEAFFTTKAEKSGTGLGLSVTKQIIDNHGGKISVESTVGKGTTFTILLPTDAAGED